MQTHSLTGTHPGLMQRDCDSGDTKDIQGKTQLCSFMAKIGGTATILLVLSSFLMQPAYTDTIFPVFSLPPIRPNLNLLWAGELFLFHPGDSLEPGPNQLIHRWKHFWRQAASLAPCTGGVSFSRKQLALAHMLQEAHLWPQSSAAHTAIFPGKLSGVYWPQVGNSLSQSALSLLVNGLRFSTGTEPEYALTW